MSPKAAADTLINLSTRKLSHKRKLFRLEDTVNTNPVPVKRPKECVRIPAVTIDVPIMADTDVKSVLTNDSPIAVGDVHSKSPSTPETDDRVQEIGSGNILAHISLGGRYRYFFSHLVGGRVLKKWVNDSVPGEQMISLYWAGRLLRA
jgi:hypothetical protein